MATPDTHAELALAVYGVDTLREFRQELEVRGLKPPGTWAGSHHARAFVKSLGFPPEFAGFEQRSLDRALEVLGPPQLNSLHPFQEKIVQEIRLMAKHIDRRRAIVSLPTGAGKTRVAVEGLIRILRESKLTGPILWVAQSIELCEQAVQTWSYVWRSVGPPESLMINRLWATNEADAETETAQVVVATIDKLQGCFADPSYDWLAKASWLVIDEAHGAIAKSYTELLKWEGLGSKRDRCPLLGLTATPFRGGEEETKRLVQRFGGVRLDHGALGDNPYAELQEMGVLARVDHQILQGSTLELSDQELANLNKLRLLPAAAGERLGADVSRNEMLLESIRSLNPQWPVLLFAVSVDHAQTMAALLSLNGISAAAISGQTEVGARRHYIEEFRRGRLRVLTNFNVLTAGFDAPSVRAIMVARPTYSAGLYQQMIGRGLRGPLNGGKERCLIVNVEDNISRFGDELAFRQFEHLWKPVVDQEEV
jgi:superfamily II DNA or RNA helicase